MAAEQTPGASPPSSGPATPGPPRGGARDAAGAVGSPFRRRWTWGTRLQVTVLGAVGAAVLRLLYATLRVCVADPSDVLGRHARGERFVFAAWHDSLVLLPVVLVRLPGRFRPRVMLSWHRDAEIAAQAARRFGVRVIRGSSTRGWVGALRGLLEAHRLGEDLLVVPDGPRGPRGVAKEGVVQIAKATGRPIVPVGLAAAPARRLRSWDRLQVPRPFARVAVHVGPPITADADPGAALARVQAGIEALAADARSAVRRGARG